MSALLPTSVVDQCFDQCLLEIDSKLEKVVLPLDDNLCPGADDAIVVSSSVVILIEIDLNLEKVVLCSAFALLEIDSNLEKVVSCSAILKR